MTKELVLIPRILYSLIFTFFATAATGLSDIPQLWWTMAAMAFIFSFVWQYAVLHYIVKAIVIKRRAVFMLVWMIVITVVSLWSLSELVNFNYQQSDDTSVVWHALLKKLFLFNVATQLFIAGACTWRAFHKHGVLNT